MSTLPKGVSWKRYWQRRRYQRLEDGTLISRKNVRVTRFGAAGGSGGHRRWFWRIKAIPKLGLRLASSPVKLLVKLKNGYIKRMLGLAGNVGTLNTQNVFGGGRVPKSRKLGKVVFSHDEVEERLVYEIYKALVATRSLVPTVE